MRKTAGRLIRFFFLLLALNSAAVATYMGFSKWQESKAWDVLREAEAETGSAGGQTADRDIRILETEETEDQTMTETVLVVGEPEEETTESDELSEHPEPEEPETEWITRLTDSELGLDSSVRLTPREYETYHGQNHDYVGWIQMATGASYPVLQGEYTTKYLHTSFGGNYSYAGSIFMNAENQADFSDRNTFIYGHNMRDGSMFGTNRLYKDKSYAMAHPYFYIHTKDGYLTYKIFDCLVAEDATEPFRVEFESNAELAEYLTRMKDRALYWIGTVRSDDHIVSLSTCSGAAGGTTRQIIQGKLVGFTYYSGQTLRPEQYETIARVKKETAVLKETEREKTQTDETALAGQDGEEKKTEREAGPSQTVDFVGLLKATLQKGIQADTRFYLDAAMRLETALESAGITW